MRGLRAFETIPWCLCKTSRGVEMYPANYGVAPKCMPWRNNADFTVGKFEHSVRRDLIKHSNAVDFEDIPTWRATELSTIFCNICMLRCGFDGWKPSKIALHLISGRISNFASRPKRGCNIESNNYESNRKIFTM